jgi:hypothetical protein
MGKNRAICAEKMKDFNNYGSRAEALDQIVCRLAQEFSTLERLRDRVQQPEALQAMRKARGKFGPRSGRKRSKFADAHSPARLRPKSWGPAHRVAGRCIRPEPGEVPTDIIDN